MKGFIYLILLATIYFTLQELLDLRGVTDAIICGAIVGASVGIIGWCIDKLKAKSNKKRQ